jgi:TRAP-type C4-dicarboxylate transport system substrate-binding protein
MMVLLAGAISVPAQVIKLGTVAPEGSPWHDALVEVGRKWSALSDGKVKLRIYAGGIAGDEQDMMRKIRIGQLHATAMTTPTLLTVVPDIEAVSFPMLVRTDDELDYVIEKLRPRFNRALEEKGFKVLGWSTAGWVRFFSKVPVITLEDMRARKFFFWGSDAVYVEVMKSAGFNPVPLAITELLPSLQTGLVDTFAAPPVAALSFQWFGLAKNMTDMPWQPMPGATVVSTRQWNKIPADLRPKLEAAAAEVNSELWRKVRELEAEATRVMVEHGLQIHKVPPDVEAQWVKLVEEKAHPKFIGPRFSREVFDEVTAALREFRSRQSAAE